MGLFRRHKPVRILDAPPRTAEEANARARQDEIRRQGMADARERMRERSEARRGTVADDDIESEDEIIEDEDEIVSESAGRTPRTPRMTERTDRRGIPAMVREDSVDEFDENERELAETERRGVEGILYRANGELIADDRDALFQERRDEAMLTQDIKDRRQARKLRRRKVNAEIRRLDRESDAEMNYMYPETMEDVEARSKEKRNTEMLKQDIKDRKQARRLNKKMGNAEIRRINYESEDDEDDEPITRSSRKMEKWEVKLKKEEYKGKKQKRKIEKRRAEAELNSMVSDAPYRPEERPQPQSRDVTINITPNGVRTVRSTKNAPTQKKSVKTPVRPATKTPATVKKKPSGTAVAPAKKKKPATAPTVKPKKKPATGGKKTVSTATKKKKTDTKKPKKKQSNGGGMDWFEEGGSGLFD